jgi:outer membrane protein W
MKHNKLLKILLGTIAFSSLIAPLASAAEGERWLKVRAVTAFPYRSKMIFSKPAVVPSSDSSTAHLAKIGFGVDVSGTYFFAHNLAAEVSLGLIYTKHKYKFSDEKARSIWSMPFTATAQFHPLTGSPVSPYIGAGIAYICSSGKAHKNDLEYGKLLTTQPGGVAGVIQFGVDGKVNELVNINLDIKKYFMANHNKTYQSSYNTANTKQIKRRYSPVVLGAGVAYKF